MAGTRLDAMYGKQSEFSDFADLLIAIEESETEADLNKLREASVSFGADGIRLWQSRHREVAACKYASRPTYYHDGGDW
jgi:hypothetical protein